MIFNCLAVFPEDIGMTVAPIAFAPWSIPNPPVNNPYPYEFWIFEFLSPPAIAIALAVHSPQMSMSFCVYPDTTGVPVVPEVLWISIISSSGTANKPNG